MYNRVLIATIAAVGSGDLSEPVGERIVEILSEVEFAEAPDEAVTINVPFQFDPE